MPARPSHLRSLRTLVAFSAALALAAAAHAQTGAITGRVTDASSGLALGGARVAIPGTNLVTFAGPSGDYVLTNVPAGARSVEISYVGYPDRTEPITIADGRTAQLNVFFGDDVVALDTLTIQGAAVGSARAINQQRAADTLTNIVAADAIGRFPDQNAAEAMQRIPGVSLYRDQGEGRYIVLRGLNYTFTSVKVNGGSFAGADLGERATALDVIPADALAAIKVTKVPTPDMDGEGLGGQVDIKTKSPFDADGFAASVSAQGQYAALTDQYSSKFNGYVSQRFGDNNQYGFLIAPTWQERKFGSYNYETGGAWFAPGDAPGLGGASSPFYTAEALEFRDYVINRERYGITTALEARPDSTLSLYLNAGYNRLTDTESRHLTLFDFTEADELSAASATSATYSDLRRYARRLRIREKDQEVFTLVAGAEKRLGAWTLDTRAGYTDGKEKRPDELTVRFRSGNTRDTTLRYDTAGAYGLTVTQLAGASFYDPASYNFQRVDLANESGSETGTDLGLNARYDFATANPAYLKFGALLRTKEKDSEGEVYELGTAPTSFTFANLAEPASDYPYLRVPRISTDAVKRAFYSNRAAFTGSRAFEDSEYEDFSLTEDVLAAYVMSGVTFDRLNVIAGLRMERTDFETTGKELDLVNETVVARTASHSYTNWLPGLYLRYDATDRLVLRASWSHSLARPSFGDTAFRSLVNSDDRELTVGNPALEALEATNWDASVEYYLPSLGLLSASVFHKEIENFSYEFDARGGATISGVLYDLTTYANGSDGSITGIELAYEHQLRFLTKPFDGVGVMANVTFLDSEATYPTRPGENIPFIGQSDYTGNLGLTYEKAGFFIRLAMNFRSERLREDEPLGEAAYQDLYVDDFKQLDLTLRYKLSAHWELFAEALNLTNEPFRVFLKSPNGQGARLGQFEEYDWSANLGLRWKL
jgi:TonB-dependent receptor